MIIVIVGPTGVGKTKLSLELAKHFNGEIINADSTQIYKEMNIGTAKNTNYENIPHHLIDIKSLNEEYTIYDYQKDGRKIIKEIQNRNKTIIIEGGSGLYINALLYNYKLKENYLKTPPNISVNTMLNELSKLNLKIDKNNLQRIERLYNKHIINKEPITNQKPKLLYNALFIGLTTDRETLYNIINNRVDEMIKEGLITEAQELFKKYPNSKQLKSTIGYKEFIPNKNLEETINKIKQNSRNYAKRQYTWFNNKMNIKWFNPNYNNFNLTIKEIITYISNTI